MPIRWHRRIAAEGLDLLAALPASAARASQELTLRLALSIALELTQGQASEELAHNLLQALALCEAVEATTALVPVLVSLTRQSMLRADRAATEQLMARERALLLQLHDPASLVQLHMQLGTAETLRGAFAQAEEHHRQALRLYDLAAHRPGVLTSGHRSGRRRAGRVRLASVADGMARAGRRSC